MLRRTAASGASRARALAVCALALSVAATAIVTEPGFVLGADPAPGATSSPSAAPSGGTDTPPPEPSTAPAASADPSPSPSPVAAPSPDPTAPVDPNISPDPTASVDPGASADPAPTPLPSADPAPTPTPTPTPSASPTPTRPPDWPPERFDLFRADGFRFQDPNPSACTATSAMDMLNFVSVAGSGGNRFTWRRSLTPQTRDAILWWERRHDTLAWSRGSDPHGWRNALNSYGWGSSALRAGSRVYSDFAFATYEDAMRATLRALIATRKPVGMVGWRGRHAQMITGYFGLTGDPFEKDARGAYTNAFTLGGFYVSDPLRSSKLVDRPVSWNALKSTDNYRLRFQRYYESDSRLDDPYTAGGKPAYREWYGKFVLVLPVR